MEAIVDSCEVSVVGIQGGTWYLGELEEESKMKQGEIADVIGAGGLDMAWL
jgi:hypothetical protein